ncbi:MAG: DUF488 domain-containing protein [Anaerolinea sp.]|nr:DUF488 domain-containing protein [Anaerolinea sp.]
MSNLSIFTIGYGARDLEQFIAVLQQYEIAYLIDVRSRPYSRYKPEFSKQALAQAVQQVGIRYLFMGDALGGQPDDADCYTGGKVDYEKVRGMDFYRRGIGRLQEAWRQELRVVIMCSEGKPEMCHRSKLIGQSLAELSIPVAHIDESDQALMQHEVMLRLNSGQPSLFGDDFPKLTSRKKYREEDDA